MLGFSLPTFDQNRRGDADRLLVEAAGSKAAPREGDAARCDR
jgi:hypothetical protein